MIPPCLTILAQIHASTDSSVLPPASQPPNVNFIPMQLNQTTNQIQDRVQHFHLYVPIAINYIKYLMHRYLFP